MCLVLLGIAVFAGGAHATDRCFADHAGGETDLCGLGLVAGGVLAIPAGLAGLVALLVVVEHRRRRVGSDARPYALPWRRADDGPPDPG